jgi:hypothetical protein
VLFCKGISEGMHSRHLDASQGLPVNGSIKTVSIIYMENKNTRIIVNISGGRRVIATGVLLGCFARHAKLHSRF